MKSKYVKGALGWDEGCAIKILDIVKSNFGLIYVVAVNTPTSKKQAWVETFLESDLKDFGPDINGDLPKESLFRLPKKYIWGKLCSNY